MPAIDKFVQAVYQSGARSVTIASGRQVVMTTGEGTRPITNQPVIAQQVLALLKEILPAEHRPAVESGQGCEFPYTSPWGVARVKLHQARGEMQLELSPGRSAAASPAPAAQAPSRAVPVSAAGAPAIDALCRKLVAEGCSDLHLSSGRPPLFRKDGEIVKLGDGTPLRSEKVRELLMEIAPDHQRAAFEETHDVDFAHEIKDLARFRVNVFMDRLGAGGVMRVIPDVIPTAEALGLPPAVLEFCHLSKGLVLVTGPTGSGKSTTLAAMIDTINARFPGHIITIEDPIEFVYPQRKALINQREIGVHTEGFKRALRAALREDPDIVLVGEMRDLETVAIAIETAETGHLVFGTLHTNTAASTVDRIIDQFPSDRQSQVRTMLSESLKGVVAQTLCRKKGGGRIAAYEILVVNHAISNLIREGKTFQIPSIMQTGKSIGMCVMNESLVSLVKKGLIDPMEAYAKSIAKAEMKSLLAREGFKVAEAAGAAE